MNARSTSCHHAGGMTGYCQQDQHQGWGTALCLHMQPILRHKQQQLPVAKHPHLAATQSPKMMVCCSRIITCCYISKTIAFKNKSSSHKDPSTAIKTMEVRCGTLAAIVFHHIYYTCMYMLHCHVIWIICIYIRLMMLIMLSAIIISAA